MGNVFWASGAGGDDYDCCTGIKTMPMETFICLDILKLRIITFGKLYTDQYGGNSTLILLL